MFLFLLLLFLTKAELQGRSAVLKKQSIIWCFVLGHMKQQMPPGSPSKSFLAAITFKSTNRVVSITHIQKKNYLSGRQNPKDAPAMGERWALVHVPARLCVDENSQTFLPPPTPSSIPKAPIVYRGERFIWASVLWLAG